MKTQKKWFLYLIFAAILFVGCDFFTRTLGVIDLPMLNVSFDADGRAPDPAAQQIKAKDSVTLPEMPAVGSDGSVFTGWDMVKPAGGGNFAAGQKAQVLQDLEFKAHWEDAGNVITVTFDVANGTLPEGISNVRNTFAGAQIVLPTPTREGFNFTGWTYGGDTFEGGETFTVPADTEPGTTITFVATWQEIDTGGQPNPGGNVTITFDLAGGELPPSTPTTLTVTSGTLATFPALIPTREGYDFFGWHIPGFNWTWTGNAGQVAGFNTNTTITAIWTEIGATFTLTLNPAGGEVDWTSRTVPPTEWLQLPTPTRAGHTFLAWRNGAGVNFFANTGVRLHKDSTLTAAWHAGVFEITVTLNLDGGTAEWTSKKFAPNEETGFLPIPTKPGYTFIGWRFARASGNLPATPNIPANMNFTAGELNNLNDITLVAAWQAGTIEFSVTLDPAGGVLTGSDVLTFVTGDALSLPLLTREGYIFERWQTADGSRSYHPSWELPKVAMGVFGTGVTSVTLTAVWRQAQGFVVNLNLAGGRLWNQGGTIIEDVTWEQYGPPRPVRPGYVFLGWETPEGVLVEPGESITLTKDITLTAKWQQGGVQITLDVNGGQAISGNVFNLLPGAQINMGSFYTGRANFVFVGWKVGATDEIVGEHATFTAPSANVTLTAQWATPHLTVRWTMHGSSSPQNRTALAGGQVSLWFNDRPGFTFVGWQVAGTDTVIPANEWGSATLSADDYPAGTVLNLTEVWEPVV